MRRTGLRSEMFRLCTIALAASAPFVITFTGFYLVDDIKMVLRGIHPAQFPIFHDPLLIQKGFFRPLVVVLCRLDGWLWSIDTWGYRLTNIILFILTSLLVYIFLRRWTSPRPAWFAALVFAFHPIQVGTVAWITGRVDLMPGLLLLATATLLIGTSSITAIVAGNLVFAAALFSKEVAITFPLVILLGEILLAGKAPRHALRRSAIIFTMVCIYLTARFVTGFWPHDEFYSPVQQTNINAWLGNAAMMLANVVYIILPFWNPMDFFRQIIESSPERATLLKPAITYLILSGIILTLLLLRLSRDNDFRRILIFGIAWFLVVSIPSLHVLRALGGSRYLFPALPGTMLIIAFLSQKLGANIKPAKLYILAIVLLVTCLAGNIFEQFRWREAMDMAKNTTYRVEACASKLPSRSNLIIFNMPHYSPSGRLLYPAFDTYSLQAAYSLSADHPRIKITRGTDDALPFCKDNEVYCIQWTELIEKECP